MGTFFWDTLYVPQIFLRAAPFAEKETLGGGGVQGQGKGQRLMNNIVANDYTWLATCQGRIYEK